MTGKPAHAGDEGAVAGSTPGHNRLHAAKEKAIEETIKFLVMFLYLFVLFGVLAIYEDIILRKHGLQYTSYGFALVNALVMAKVMLIAQDLHAGRRFENWPLIYPIVLKSLLFAIILIVFHVIEDTVAGVWHGKTVSESIPGFGGGGFEGLLAVGVVAFVVLIPFFGVSELSRVLGAAQMRALIFKRGADDAVVELKWRSADGASR